MNNGIKDYESHVEGLDDGYGICADCNEVKPLDELQRGICALCEDTIEEMQVRHYLT